MPCLCLYFIVCTLVCVFVFVRLLVFLMFFQQGFALIPLVIAVGDYVLTPEICVERKSLSDLFQSMPSGRLYNQARLIS